jgi:putative membrane protein
VPGSRTPAPKRPAPDRSWLSHQRYPIVLFALLVAFAGALAINPHDRADWALENALMFGGLGVLIATRRKLPLSRVSYTLIFVFLCLHSIGAHYTYSEVPYQEWWARLTGQPVSEGRNHYDRAVHFAYGLLLAYPVREVFLRVAAVRGFWGYYLPLDVTMATSMIYELIEWGAAEFFGGELGVAYLGSQGDPWDAQKDMALATLGAIIAMCVTAALNWRYQRDFARDWADSLRVKSGVPLGEDELRRLIDDSHTAAPRAKRRRN